MPQSFDPGGVENDDINRDNAVSHDVEPGIIADGPSHAAEALAVDSRHAPAAGDSEHRSANERDILPDNTDSAPDAGLRLDDGGADNGTPLADEPVRHTASDCGTTPEAGPNVDDAVSGGECPSAGNENPETDDFSQEKSLVSPRRSPHDAAGPPSAQANLDGSLVVRANGSESDENPGTQQFHQRGVADCRKAFRRADAAHRKGKELLQDLLEKVMLFISDPRFDTEEFCRLAGRTCDVRTRNNPALAVLEFVSGVDPKIASKQGLAIKYALHLSDGDVTRASAFLREHGVETSARWGREAAKRLTDALEPGSSSVEAPTVVIPVHGVPFGLGGVVTMRIEVVGRKASFISLQGGVDSPSASPSPFPQSPTGRVFDAQLDGDASTPGGGEAGASDGETPVGEAPAAT